MDDLTKNINAEGGVLGSMIIDRNCISDVRSILKDDFYFSKIEHRILYNFLCTLSDTADGWDLVIMRDALKEQGLLDAVGGIEYVIHLAHTVPTAANAIYYAMLVEKAYKRRRIAEHSETLRTAATSPGDVHAALQDVLRDIHELTGDIFGVDTIDGAEAVERVIDDSIFHRRRVIRMPWSITSRLSAALQPGTVTILCGSPGASKSFAALELLAFVQEEHSAAYFALEDSKAFHLMRLLAQRTETPGLTNPEWIEHNPEIAKAAYSENADWLRKIGLTIEADGGGTVHYDTLEAWALRKARAGVKLLIIDPITAVQHKTRQSWTEDNDFLQQLKRISVDYGAAVVLVTHPSKLQVMPGMDGLAGGATFSRFAQTVLWLEAHDHKTSDVQWPCGADTVSHNRTFHLLKTRLGLGQGLRIAATFTETLRLIEHGVVVKRKQGYEL